jgi:hypothetical protein
MKILISLFVSSLLIYASSLYNIDDYIDWNKNTRELSAKEMSLKFYDLLIGEEINKNSFFIIGENKKLLMRVFKDKVNVKDIFNTYNFIKLKCKDKKGYSICSFLLNKNNIDVNSLSFWGEDPGLSYVDPFYVTFRLELEDGSYKIKDIY